VIVHGSSSEGAPCPLLPSNGAIWGIFVAKWDIMSDNSFKVPTFPYLFLLNESNSPNFPISHHLPMSLRENSMGYVLLFTKISIFSSSFFFLYFRIVEFHIYIQIVFLHCLHFVIISYYLTSTSKRSKGVVFFCHISVTLLCSTSTVHST
jgi:hypothetical protein